MVYPNISPKRGAMANGGLWKHSAKWGRLAQPRRGKGQKADRRPALPDYQNIQHKNAGCDRPTRIDLPGVRLQSCVSHPQGTQVLELIWGHPNNGHLQAGGGGQ